MFPADTLGQARSFWNDEDRVSRVRELLGQGWQIAPNMHFTYRGTGLVDTRGPLGVDDYMNYWQEHIDETGALAPAEWNEYWKCLVEDGVAHSGDRVAFDAKFTNTKRHNAVPCPGLIAGKGWSLAAAEDADDEGRLPRLVREVINEMLRALGEAEVPALVHGAAALNSDR